MRHAVVYFEIPVLDLDRAEAFYSEAGGITGALAS
jgi:predicted enzyme related to lactoylglutathione lyase